MNNEIMNNNQNFYNYQISNSLIFSNPIKTDINIKNNISQSVYNPLLFSVQIPKQNYNLNNTPRTPSPFKRTRNIINLNDNHRFKPSNSPVVYRKLKGMDYINNSPMIEHRILVNIPNFPLNNNINNINNNRSILLTNSPNSLNIGNQSPKITKNRKDRKFIIDNINLRKHSYDNINYNMNISQNHHNTRNNTNIINSTPIILNNNYNIYLKYQNNYNSKNHNINMNQRVFNAIKQRNNSEVNLNINPFNENSQIHKYKESIETTKINPYNNYINSIDITKNSDNSQNNKYSISIISNTNNDINLNNNYLKNITNNTNNSNNDNSKNYINKINLTNLNNFSQIYDINKNRNDLNSQIFVENKNFSTILTNESKKNIVEQQRQVNIIPIPKFISHLHFKENGAILKNINAIQQTNSNPHDNFNLKEFKIIKKIGKGGSGEIYAVQWIKNNKLYALKILKLLKEELNMFQDRVKIVKGLLEKTGHNGFIKIFADKCLKLKNEDEFIYYIIMELGERDWIKELKNRETSFLYYSEIELLGIIKQLVKTLSLMQKCKVTHRDIKPQNILLCKGLFKLCDFGESRILKGNGQIWQHIRGSELYMSPILFYALSRKEKNVIHNTYKSDVFSLGMCILLAAGFSRKLQCEVREAKDMNIISEIINNALNKRYSQNLINLIIQMLQIDENLRYDFIELEKYISSIWP